MYTKYSVKLILVFCLTISLLLTVCPVGKAAGQEDLFSDVKGKVDTVTEKEKETLQNLFTQEQIIKETEKKAAEAANNIKKAEARIEYLKKLIAKNEAACEKERESLKQVLQCYQRMGPGSYLEIVLDSDNLADLLMRINTLRDLTRNTGELMDRITKDREEQAREKAKMSAELEAVKKKQQQLEQTLVNEKRLKENMEKYLASLADERGRFEKDLNNLKMAWSEVKPFFESTAKELSEFTAKTPLPPDALKLSFSLFGVKAAVSEETINGMLAGDPQLSKTKFAFSSGKVKVEFPERNLALTGTFVVKDGKSLVFEPEDGSFYGMPLEKGTITDLLQNVNLELDLSSLLEGNTIKSIDITDGYLTISI